MRVKVLITAEVCGHERSRPSARRQVTLLPTRSSPRRLPQSAAPVHVGDRSKALLRYFGCKRLDAISADNVEQFKDWRRRQKKLSPHRKLAKNKRATSDKPIKPATVNRELACLRAMMNYFIRNDVLVRNPVSRVKFLKEDNEQIRVVTEDEERLYLMAATQPLRDVAVVMLETGA